VHRSKETRKAAQEKEQAHQKKLANALDAQKKEAEKLVPKESQERIDLSNKRKKYLEREEQRKQEMERRRQEAERLERERQGRHKKMERPQEIREKLEAERAVLRKQLEDGVEAIYQEAMGLYKAGKYAEAGEKFNDVQDIIPDYKQAKDLMNKSMQQPPLHGVSRNKSVENALDRFESNVR